MCKGRFTTTCIRTQVLAVQHMHCCSLLESSNDCDLAGSGTGLFPAFGAPTNPGTGLFGQTGASTSSSFGGRPLSASGQLTVQYNVQQEVYGMQLTTCKRFLDWLMLLYEEHAIISHDWHSRVFNCQKTNIDTTFRCICFFPSIFFGIPSPQPTPAQRPALLFRVWPALPNPSRRPFWSATCCLLFFFLLASCLLGFQHSFRIWIVWIWSIFFCCIPRCCFNLNPRLLESCTCSHTAQSFVGVGC